MKTRYLISSCLVIAAIAACGKKKSATDSADAVVNALAEAYPSGLALAAFPQSTDAAGGLYADAVADKAPEDKDLEDLTLKDKKELEKKVMEGKGDDCMPPILKKKMTKPAEETCYEFDQDMIYSSRTQNGVAKVLGTKNGKNAAGEACMVAFARTQIAEIADHVDRANAQIQAMMCQAKKNNADVALPKVGDAPLDLKEAMGTALGKKAAKLESATIEASADTAGNVVYKSTVKMTDERGTSRTIVLRHTPGADSTDENPVYNGTLSVRMKRGADDGGAGASEKERFISITYARSVESEKPALKYELRTAQFNDALVESAFSTEGVVNYNAGSEANGDYKINNVVVQANQAVDGMMYIAFSGNPETNEGTLSYWKNPGGNYNEAARGMLTEIKASATDGTLSGCAISGAVLDSANQGLSIRKSLVTGDALKPGGFYHPFHNTVAQNGQTVATAVATDADGSYWTKSQTSPAESLKWYVPAAGTNSSTFVTSQVGGFISKQCYKQASSGLYEIDAATTTEAAGFSLIATTDTSKLFNPPALKGVKTDGKTEKKE